MVSKARGVTRQERRQQIREANANRSKTRRAPVSEFRTDIIPLNRPRRIEFNPLRERQNILANLIRCKRMIFALGPAGTGKTYVGICIALVLLYLGLIKQIILTKPFVEIDSPLGILPGDEQEKTEVQFRNLKETFIKIIGKAEFEDHVRQDRIVFRHLGSILGATYDDAVMIMDEAQNATVAQTRVFLTRLGKRTKVLLCGDYKEQQFIDVISGLEDASIRFSDNDQVGLVEFDEDDIVRDDFVKDIILGYRKPLPKPGYTDDSAPDFISVPVR